MGQYWVLLNYDAGETLTNLGKLGEGLFEFSFEALVPMLQAQKPVTLLAKPQDSYWEMWRMMEEFGWKRRTRRRARPFAANALVLDRLPAEIILMIFTEMTKDCVDCICLGLCNRRLWSIARGVITKRLREIDTFSSWAGDRLICVGDYTEPEDLPPEMPFDEYCRDFTNKKGYLRTMYAIADETWPVADYGNRHRHIFIERGLQTRGLQPGHFDMRLWEALKGPEFCYSKDAYPSSHSPSLLRNLTTHEYIHDGILAEWNERLSDWGDRVGTVESALTLGHLCAIRICWSSEGGERLDAHDKIHRGVWAAHRFDIVPAAELEKMKDEKAWKDVSKEVMAEMEDIWSAILPDSWKEETRDSE